MGWPLGRVVVSGPSMVPTLRHGDWLVVRWRAPVRPGDVVVVRRPDGLDVKRALRRGPSGGWWVEGDNPFGSTDSREYGEVTDGDVLGRVVWRYWPLRRSSS